MILYEEIVDYIGFFKPEYAGEIYSEDVDLIYEAIREDKNFDDIFLTPKGGYHDSSFVALKFAFDIIKFLFDVTKFAKNYMAQNGQEPSEEEMKIVVVSSMKELPKDVKEKCLEMDLQAIVRKNSSFLK